MEHFCCFTVYNLLDTFCVQRRKRILLSKVQAVLDLQPPSTLKRLISLLGMVQFYSDWWQRRNHILVLLIDLVGKGKKTLACTNMYQKFFEEMKSVMTKETILNYPDFSKEFEIHNDVSDRQLGAVIAVEEKDSQQIISFCGRRN